MKSFLFDKLFQDTKPAEKNYFRFINLKINIMKVRDATVLFIDPGCI